MNDLTASAMVTAVLDSDESPKDFLKRRQVGNHVQALESIGFEQIRSFETRRADKNGKRVALVEHMFDRPVLVRGLKPLTARLRLADARNITVARDVRMFVVHIPRDAVEAPQRLDAIIIERIEWDQFFPILKNWADRFPAVQPKDARDLPTPQKFERDWRWLHRQLEMRQQT